jgi:hypothetical protein
MAAVIRKQSGSRNVGLRAWRYWRRLSVGNDEREANKAEEWNELTTDWTFLACLPSIGTSNASCVDRAQPRLKAANVLQNKERWVARLVRSRDFAMQIVIAQIGTL